MVTIAQVISDRSRKLSLWARIESIGLYLDDADLTAAGDDSRIRFCTSVPSHASSQPTTLWRDYVCMPLPEFLSEETPSWGGVSSYGAVRLNLLDYNNVLSTLLAVDTPAVAITDLGTAVTDAEVRVADGANITVDSIIYINEEAMRVDNITGTAPAILDVTRGWSGTSVVGHPIGSPVFIVSPFLIDRRMEIVLCPEDSSSSADEVILGQYKIDSVEWTSTTNVWSISGTSTLRDLDKIVPYSVQSFVVSGIDRSSSVDGRGELLYYDGGHIDPWDPWFGGTNSDTETILPIDSFAMTGSGEIIGLDQSTFGNGYYRVSARGLLGSSTAEIELGETITRIFVSGNPLDHLPGSFMSLDPGDDDVSADTATRGCHFVDIILGIMTSAQKDEWSQGGNGDGTHRNYSTLPVGYGLGIPVSDIDVASFEDVKRRTIQFVHSFFVFGEEQKPGTDLIVELLEPVGAIMGVDNGQITLTLPAMSVPGETVAEFDHDGFLSSSHDGFTYEPRVKTNLTSRRHVGGFEYNVGHESNKTKVSVTSNDVLSSGRRGAFGSPQPQTFDTPTIDGDLRDLVASRGIGFLVRQSKPRVEMDCDVDVSSSWSARPGVRTEVTLEEVPNLTGGRGWTAMPGMLRRREHKFTSADGLYSTVSITSFGERFTGRRIAPAAWVESVATNTATVTANLYTSSDAPAATGLPTHDLEPFTIGDVVRLLNPDGTSAGGTTQVVVDIDTGTDTIELDGDFGGNLATDTIIVCADYDDCTAAQQARFAFEADTDQLIGGSQDTAVVFSDE